MSLLVAVMAGSFWLVNSETVAQGTSQAQGSSQFRGTSKLKRASQPEIVGQATSLSTPVAPQAVVIEAKSLAPVDKNNSAALNPVLATGVVPDLSADKSENKGEKVWLEINDAISSLNELVGTEMFLEVVRLQKGQMEVRVDGEVWKRVRYQTRVDLKTDISNLWHLYVSEYGNAGSSVVYFIDHSSDRVIDIFSRAN